MNQYRVRRIYGMKFPCSYFESFFSLKCHRQQVVDQQQIHFCLLHHHHKQILSTYLEHPLSKQAMADKQTQRRRMIYFSWVIHLQICLVHRQRQLRPPICNQQIICGWAMASVFSEYFNWSERNKNNYSIDNIFSISN